MSALLASPSVPDALASQSNLVGLNSINAANASLGQSTNIVRGRLSPLTGGNAARSSVEISTPIGQTPPPSSVADIEPAAGDSGAEPSRLYTDAQRTYWLEGIGGFGNIDGGGRARGASYESYGGFGYAEIVHDLKVYNNITLSPYAGMESGVLYHEGYSEKGAGALNIDAQSETTTSLSSEIGISAHGQQKIGELNVKPALKIGWAHEFLDSASETTANFSGVQNSTYKTQGQNKIETLQRSALTFPLRPLKTSQLYMLATTAKYQLTAKTMPLRQVSDLSGSGDMANA